LTAAASIAKSREMREMREMRELALDLRAALELVDELGGAVSRIAVDLEIDRRRGDGRGSGLARARRLQGASCRACDQATSTVFTHAAADALRISLRTSIAG
jgi:hypothetical protein